MAKILVTGAHGFVGKHLVKEFHQRGHQIIGVGREANANDDVAGLLSGYVSCDLTEETEVAKLPINDITAVVNLAGLARVGDSFGQADKYKHVNVAVLAVLGNRLVSENKSVRVIAISTGAVYSPRQSLPLTEGSEVNYDNSPYAVSKLLMEQAAEQLRSRGLDCVVARPFNHIGPGQDSGFLVPDLYAKICGAMKNGQPVRVGNLKTRRDYTDVRDVVKAYADLATAPDLSHSLYNICSSKTVAGEQILDSLLKLVAAPDSLKIEVDQALIRPGDPPELYGSYQRIHAETGWSPKIPLQNTLEDVLKSKVI